MNGFEWNKIFAAVLLAGLVAMFAGFVAQKLVNPTELQQAALAVPEDAAPVAAVAEAPKGPTDILPMLATADIANGQKVSRACVACHSFEQGGVNKVGPNLYNIVNAKHAHLDNFNYSDALMAMHDKPWGYAELNHFLYAPKDYAKGTKMAYAGLKNDKDRADLIAWLRTLAPTPAPLP